MKILLVEDDKGIARFVRKGVIARTMLSEKMLDCSHFDLRFTRSTARLRVNLEQASTFGPGSREIHKGFEPKRPIAQGFGYVVKDLDSMFPKNR